MAVMWGDASGDPTAQSLAAELGIPSGAPVRRVLIDGGGFGASWALFRLDMLGIEFRLRPGDPLPPGPAMRVGVMEDGLDRAVQLWQQTVRYPESPIYLESRWHPNRGQTYSIRGLEHGHRKVDVEQAWRSLGLLKLVQRQSRRADKTRDQVLEDMHRAIQSLRERGGRRITARALMREMAIGKSVFYEDNARFSIDWHEEIRRIAAFGSGS